MNAKKLMLLTGIAVVVLTSGTSQLANAGIDAGGKPVPLAGKSLFSRGGVNKIDGLYVNGVRFNTDNAVFIIDRRIGDESEIGVGQVVSVVGAVNGDGENGTALIVTYDDSVAGPVSTIDLQVNRVEVLGQTIVINSDTLFAMASNAVSITDLNANDEITVSGFKNANGEIVATYIGDSGARNGLELTGTITDVELGSMIFAVNNLRVDYSRANLYDLRFGAPTVGQKVDIGGARFNASGQLLADNVWAVAPAISPDSGTIGALEGFVTKRLSSTDFEVDGIRVTVTSDTQFLTDEFVSLRLNHKVEIEGTFDASGVLVAEKIDFEHGSRPRQRGRRLAGK